jgi:serine/threonine protein kinase
MATSVYDQLEPPMSYNYRDVPELKELFLEKVQKTGISLGSGAFGVVEELTAGSTHYAGKTLHYTLLDAHNEGKDRIIKRFISECKMVSQVRHPNIVQFMGLCLFRNSIHPSIVMEKLDLSLENVLEAYCNLPLPLIVRILKDIVKGLIYLHGKSPPIVHCDLTARNVLVNKASMFAKIADLGNALMIDPAQLSNTLSQTPGTLLYMPPEAILCKPKYDSMLDMFSFGHLGLFAVTQKYPGNLLPSTYMDPSTKKLLARSEVERREEYTSILVAKLSEDHAVTKVIFRCLHNFPEERYANLAF